LERRPGAENTNLVAEVEQDESVVINKGVVLGWVIFDDLVSGTDREACGYCVLKVVDNGQIAHQEASSSSPDVLKRLYTGLYIVTNSIPSSNFIAVIDWRRVSNIFKSSILNLLNFTHCLHCGYEFIFLGLLV